MEIMRIGALRKRRGLTQRQLAEGMGMAQNAISNWESGISLPRARDIPRLADVLGCTIDELFVRSDCIIPQEEAESHVS